MAADPTEHDFGATVRAYAPDQIVFSRFKLVRMLGRGGMGVVWLAYDRRLEREVALKFLPETVAHDPRSVDDLKRETRRSLDLTHPHIVRIYDFFEDQSASAISMEYVEGGTLAKLAVEQPLRCFEPRQILPWIRQMVDALDYAHTKAKIVHRDLKPANLMIANNGDLKVTDFGISATVTDSLTRVSRLMSSGATPAYSSPQQVMGERASPADDIYSLGATIYDLVTGKPPFHTGNLLIQVQTKPAPSLTERRDDLGVVGVPIPPSWETTIAACLAKDPAQRPANVRAVLAGLEGGDLRLDDGLTTLQRRTPPKRPGWLARIPWLRPKPPSAGPIVPLRRDNAFGFQVAWGMLRGARSLKGFGRCYRALVAGLAGPAPRVAAILLPLLLVVVPLLVFLPSAPKAPQVATDPEGDPGIVFNTANFAEPSAPAAVDPATQPPVIPANAPPPPPPPAEPARPRTSPATAAGTGTVEILSEPAGALVLAEGRELGRTPLALPGLRPGAAQFLLRLAGHEEAALSARVVAGETTRIAASLRAIPAPPPPLQVRDLGITLLWLQPGEVVLGSPESESGPGSDEQPQTTVRLTRGFWIGETEITQRQWWLLMETNPSRNLEGGERAPVERVSWEQADAFCRRLDERERGAGRVPEGYAYQLPTEAQWEYACRAGTTGPYAGDLARIAVTGGRDSASKPVGSLDPNPWGLYDMHGNVAEWTRSWYGSYPGGTLDDYAGPAEGAVRVFRGGAFDSPLRGLRSAYREWVTASEPAGNRGFRIVLAPQVATP